MSYVTPPSFVFSASAWVSPGPGAFGSAKGNAAAAVGEAGEEALPLVDGADALPGEAPPSARAGSGLAVLRSATPGFALEPGRMNTAGCCLVAPPTGIIATARCFPGASRTCAASAQHGRALRSETELTSEVTVPG